MKKSRLIIPSVILIIISSCTGKENLPVKLLPKRVSDLQELNIPVDKGFSEYITGYTSGIISVNSVFEVKFTPEFVAGINRKIPAGLFIFEPAVKGKAEWTDNVTLAFKPARPLKPGTLYTVKLNLAKLAEVKENLGVFTSRIKTKKKDFVVSIGVLESSDDGTKYTLHGNLVASDYVASTEAESYVQAKYGRKKLPIIWDHSDILEHRFSVINIERKDKAGKVEVSWNGHFAGVKQKGSSAVKIPGTGVFAVTDLIFNRDEGQSIDIVFSDPLDASQETEGLIRFNPDIRMSARINANIVSLFPESRPGSPADIIVEESIKNFRGESLTSSFIRRLDFTPVPPSVELTGNGVILPASNNLVLPFRTANLNAVDLRIIKIFGVNLPYFLQDNDINTSYSVKRFGRLIYSGRVDLINPPGTFSGSWNFHTIDLAEYIDVEPGILYRVELGFRPSYSLYPCPDRTELEKYEESLEKSEEETNDYWDDPDNYYDDAGDMIYYSLGFNWNERNDPCKPAYYSPDRKVTRNVLASNFGIIAKKGTDNSLLVMVNDLLTALPLSEVTIDVYDLQMQLIVSRNTGHNGSVTMNCDRKPFLIIARKDRDRNYLKVTDGSSLSLSSFDVSGNKTENGIKAFIYGERDVWRPGDSIYLSIFLKDLNKNLPAGHPLQFELINPLEQRIDNQVQQTDGRNLLVFKTGTATDAVTGNYSAIFRVGGATFTRRVRIESIKPNRLKMELSFPGNLLKQREGGTPGSLTVKWLNGNNAGNLRSSVEYRFKPAKTEFEKYRQYVFDDPSVDFYSETVRMFEGTTDEKGEASVSFNPGTDIPAPGMLNAVFTVKAAEKGGDESITQKLYRYSPYETYVGLNLPGLKENERMIFTDTDHELRIATVDPQGKPVDTRVDIYFYRINYRWWWESDEENLASYISNNSYKPVLTHHLRTSNGTGSFRFNIGRNDWGRYLIRATAASGHSTGKIILIDWPWEYGMKSSADGATLLSVSTDKEKYAPGEEIRLSFPAPENSRAIITLENSSTVLEEIRTPASKGNTVVSIKAKPGMAPNCYAFVTVIQPHAQTVNDMPIRLYGIVPVMVEDPATRLDPVISAPDEIRSQKSFDITVSEANRKPMTYTVAVVDEGLLDITAFRTPDPWSYFYGREALGVRTWDVYDHVLGAFGGTLERLLATGGDEAITDRSAGKAQRFRPVIKFLGPFTLQPGKSSTHTITLPQYTGSIRTMVIAGSERAFGSAEKSLLVRDPLMVLATAPRVLSPGERVTLPVTVFVQKSNITSLDLMAEAGSLIKFDEPVKSITVAGQGETDTRLVFTTAEKTGKEVIKVTVSGGGETAVHEIEIDVRSPNPPEIRAVQKLLKRGEKWETSFNPFGIAGSDAATLELSDLPAANFDKWLDYLLEYPHGCTEQIISAAFPQLLLHSIAGDGAKAEKSATNIKEAVLKVVSRQMTGGGVAMWPGNYQPDNWVTSYAGHFMAEAERTGYSIPGNFRQKWTRFQKKTAQDWRFDPKFRQSANDQAYRLFTLALAGDPERGAMNRMREIQNLPGLARWLLAAAYATSGKPEVADRLLDMRNTGTEEEYSGYYYGSRMRDRAVILYTLTLLKKDAEGLPLLRAICDELNTAGWFSTQSLSWGLFSYMKYSQLVSADKPGSAKISVSLNGEKSEISVPEKKIFVKELQVRNGPNRLVVENISDQPVYANLVRKGIPLVSDATQTEKGLTMSVEYLNMELKQIDHRNLVQGTDFMMVVKVTNKTFLNLDNIALTQMVPSGWEIQNTRLFEANYGIQESVYDHRDFRDDRVNTYFSLNQGESKTYLLILNAAYKGEFHQPPVWCEAMYSESCYSRIPGGKVKVTDNGIE
ncbi:MAG TPA: MG2 domain-containing protein [Bacteroidales bacterium]|nr:MG2 domain-containing protein [Bacteroidales bacterium]